MHQQVAAIREAVKLWKTDSTAETVAALALILVVIGVPLYRAYTSRS